MSQKHTQQEVNKVSVKNLEAIFYAKGEQSWG